MLEEIKNLLYSNGIRPNTGSYTDYEFCKSKLYEIAFRRYKIEFEKFIHIVIDYLGI